MLTVLSKAKSFGGTVFKYSHPSALLGCEMKLSVFVPANSSGAKLPAVYFLSGLTCNEDNFITKAGAIRTASRLGLVLICPDTSPRGLNIEGDSASWDFGVGAGFYVDATEPKWSKYQMYSYITAELPEIVAQNLPVDPSRTSIFGHSMGGHGALICALKNPGQFKSASAFAPISNPINCAWGKKAFTGYLGEAQESWKAYDATELARGYRGAALSVLIDQGGEDSFLKDGQLLPDNLVSAASHNALLSVDYRLQPGYDHSYWFISTFVDDHLEFHAKHLSA
ncbi:S-formylglutathione hydrolase [Entophlyctis helioformis]|nr:S-formylglutathione hydrolase [Entophlyctis helioformis]